MKRILNIVLILALVLLPITPMDASADDSADGVWIAAIVAVALGIAIVRKMMESDNINDRDKEQENLLAEEVKKLEPIENVAPQTNFTPTENANVHGAMYPVFEW